MDEKMALLEAAMFLSTNGLNVDQLAEILGLGSPGYVQNIIAEFEKKLNEDFRGLELIENKGKYSLKVKKGLVDKVAHLAPDQDIPPGTLRTLALIAYETPVKQSRIIDIRGNRGYYQIKELKERGLVSAEKKGRTKVLSVTKDFLDYFGLETPEEFKLHFSGEKEDEL